MKEFKLREDKDIVINQLISLYKSVNWGAYTKDTTSLKRAVLNSTYVVSAWKDDNLIGLARCISDDVSIFYLQDILVRPEFQRQGIGRILFEKCLQKFKHVRTKLLITDNEEKQIKFYESLGFKNTRHLKKIELNAFVKMNGINLE